MATDAQVLAAFHGDRDAAQARIAAMVSANPEVWCLLVFDAQGNIIAGANAKGKDIRGESRAGRDYYKEIMAGKASYLGRTVLRGKSDKNMIIFTAADAIRDAGGKPIGGVGIFVFWNAFTRRFIDPLRFGAHGYAFMLDAAGRVIAHGRDKTLLFTSVADVPVLQEALRRQKGEVYYDRKGDRRFLSFCSDPETGFLIGMTADVPDLIRPATVQRDILLGIGLAAMLLLAGIIVLLVRRLVVRPIDQLREYSAAIGRREYGAEQTTGYRFELAELATNIYGMVDQMKERLGFSQGVLNGFVLPCVVYDKDNRTSFINSYMLKALDKDCTPEDCLGRTSGDLVWGEADRATVSQQALREGRMVHAEVAYPVKSGERIFDVTSTPIKDLDGAVIGTLAVWVDLTNIRAQQKKIEEQNDRIAAAATTAESISDQVASAAEELAAQIEQSSRGAEEQNKQTTSAATAMTEMNSTVLEVAKNASTAAELAENAKAKAKNGKETVERVVQTIGRVREQAERLRSDMGQLGKQAEAIGEIIGVIADIADQTNLLALNAAIEAARAGDAGRGFAVVADEVRKLAEKTMSATKKVGESVQAIQKSAQSNIANTESTATAVERTTDMAGESGAALEEIVGIVEKTADQVRGIATASEEQSAASEEISRTTEEISHIAGDTSAAMTQSGKAVSELSRLAQELRALIAEMHA